MEVLFIKFNYKDMLNQYLTNIFIFLNNLYNLYFNIKGEGSTTLINDIKMSIDNLNSIYRELSFLIKKIGGYPIMNLEEIKNISTIKEISSKDYTPKDAINLLLNDFNVINSMNNQVGEYAIKSYDLRSINLTIKINQYIQDIIYSLKRNI